MTTLPLTDPVFITACVIVMVAAVWILAGQDIVLSVRTSKW